MKLKDKLKLTGLAALLGVAGYIGYNNMQDVAKERAYYAEQLTRKDLKVGMKAPDFTLKSLDGREISLSNLEDKIVILDFWATWCGPCKQLTPHLKKLYETSDRDKLEIVLVATKDSAENVTKYLKENSFPFPVIFDYEKRLATAYGVKCLPTMAFINRGVLECVIPGFGPTHVQWLENYRKEKKLEKN